MDINKIVDISYNYEKHMAEIKFFDFKVEEFFFGIYNSFSFWPERIFGPALGLEMTAGLSVAKECFFRMFNDLLNVGILSPHYGNDYVSINLYGSEEDQMRQLVRMSSHSSIKDIVDFCLKHNDIEHIKKLASFGLNTSNLDLSDIFL